MSEKIKTLKVAFPYTIPILTGYLFLGAAWGILMESKGYSVLWTTLISLFTYAGSMQFVAVSLLALGFNPLYACFMTLMVNARHLFYGIVMLDNFKGTGKMKPYLIFGLTDETFSILCSTKPPEDVDNDWFMFFVTLLDHLYWILGTVLGSIIGTMLSFNTKGLDFVLTSLFIVIFINQWKSTQNHLPVIIALSSTIICRILFGPANFIIPSMFAILILVTVLKKPIEVRDSK
jgi:4-azaleucine resistance transporter AzlC